MTCAFFQASRRLKYFLGFDTNSGAFPKSFHLKKQVSLTMYCGEILLVVVIIFTFDNIVVVHGHGTSQTATVYKEGGQFSIKLGVLDKEGLAYGIYNDTFLTTGWGELNVKAGYSSKQYDEDDVAFASGYLEGYLTSKEIFQHTVNINDSVFHGSDHEFPEKLSKFFQQQDEWMRMMIRNNSGADPLWRGISLILSQYDGLVTGYNANPYKGKEVNVFSFQVINGCGDIIDLQHVLMPGTIPSWKSMTKSQLSSYVARNGHCSALVKVLPGLENLFMSHSSWFVYQGTLRIYKHYDLNLPGLANTKMSFSSYPGVLESLDDFYHMSSGLTVLQTTNPMFNNTLYTLVTPQSLLAWQRVRLASHLAVSGKEWGRILAWQNSGTYNNQYMIIDRSKFVPKTAILDDALWVVEQIPTIVVYEDQTNILRAGYWPSYNVPFYEVIFNMSGFPEVVAKHGPDFSYQLAPRAKIFRRDQGTVTDMDSMKMIMRYNDYENDPYSEGDPVNSICARGDLRATDASADGCYDTKVSDWAMAAKFQSFAINGPTRNGGSLPPFSWTGQFQNVSHLGLPKTYDFDFVTMQPVNLP